MRSGLKRLHILGWSMGTDRTWPRSTWRVRQHRSEKAVKSFGNGVWIGGGMSIDTFSIDRRRAVCFQQYQGVFLLSSPSSTYRAKTELNSPSSIGCVGARGLKLRVWLLNVVDCSINVFIHLPANMMKSWFHENQNISWTILGIRILSSRGKGIDSTLNR